jgi:class 3 adenylate cyclase/alpha-beta hydrolase superfamily lysophospholipase
VTTRSANTRAPDMTEASPSVERRDASLRLCSGIYPSLALQGRDIDTSAMSDRDEYRFARSGDVSIAYAVYGDGPRDLVFVHGALSNIEIERETPEPRAFQDCLRRFCRLIVFDKRGTGLSDRLREPATLETRMDDLRAVLDAAHSERAVLFGTAEAAAMCMLFAATYPDRTLGLALFAPFAKGTWAPDYPWAQTPEEWRRSIAEASDSWGTYAAAERSARQLAPARASEPEFIAALARRWRLSASPGAVATILRMMADVDVRNILGAIRVPTLILHEIADREEAAYIASRIPGADRFELSGPGGVYFQEGIAPRLEQFVETLGVDEPDTVLATILFTDIVGSTAKLSELGDTQWRELVERHHALVRHQLGRFRGREIDTAGDGFFATFDGPIRAIRCAQAIREAVRELDLELRAGLHTGECQIVGDKIAGIAVNIGARIAARAEPGEILVSSTVKDIVAGSGLQFEERQPAELKGLPGQWQLHAVADERAETHRTIGR